MNLPTFLPLFLLAFTAGALVGVVLLSCWLRAIQRRLASRALGPAPRVRTTILDADDAHWSGTRRFGPFRGPGR